MRSKNLWTRLIAALFWAAIWFIVAQIVPDILFSGPFETLQSLFRQVIKLEFWLSISHSLCKVAFGFLFAFFFGIGLATLGYFIYPVRILLEPAIQIMKTVPVACFIVVALIWMHASYISVLVSFFVVFPLVYIQFTQGLTQVNRELLEMAQVFQVSRRKKLASLYFPQILPYLLSSCKLGIGMAWKAGIAGEIIGLPTYSIGEQLYLSKLYLNTDDLFAWTIVIILISLLCEKLMICGLHFIEIRWQRTSK